MSGFIHKQIMRDKAMGIQSDQLKKYEENQKRIKGLDSLRQRARDVGIDNVQDFDSVRDLEREIFGREDHRVILTPEQKEKFLKKQEESLESLESLSTEEFMKKLQKIDTIADELRNQYGVR